VIIYRRLLQITLSCFLVFLFGMPEISSAAQRLEDVVFLTENLPPYVYHDGKEATGLSIEVFHAALNAVGVDKKDVHVDVVPWARAYNEALHVTNSCTFMMVRNEKREKLFKWAGPVVDFNLVFASKIGTVLIRKIEDIKHHMVGVVRADSAYSSLIKAGQPSDMIEQSTNIREVVSKVEYGRLEMMLADERIIAHHIESIGAELDDFETNFFLERQVGYFAFNKDVPDEVVATMQRGLDTIRASGELDRILGKFHLEH